MTRSLSLVAMTLVCFALSGTSAAWAGEGAVAITVEPADAEIYVDGVLKATTSPVILRLPAGQRRIEVRGKGSPPEIIDLSITDGAVLSKQVRLFTGPEMVVIPAGSFTMGSGLGDEGPQHQVVVTAFALGKYTVTFDEWDACVAGGGCNGYRPDDNGWGRGQRPVIKVSWNDAQAYVQWLSRKMGKSYRLPSEAEWEYTARAGTTTQYWWGDAIGRNNANCDGCGSQWDNKQTAPVGSFAPNPFGLYDMTGNVWQWVEDCYHNSYQGAPTNGDAWTAGDVCSFGVARGGSWSVYPDRLRSAFRFDVTPDLHFKFFGFRVARTLNP